MSVKFLTVEQHQEVLSRLAALGRQVDKIPEHSAGFEYTSVMMCFLMHNISAAESLHRISTPHGNEWYPVTVGYAIARTMFEVDVTAHYVSQAPAERAHRYIAFGAILTERQLDACAKHRGSSKPLWREGMNLLWDNYWANREAAVRGKSAAVSPLFKRSTKAGKGIPFQNWSGKTIRQMAIEVDHVEAYDVFYSELSSFAHADVHLADRFLKVRPQGPTWSRRADEYDVGNVFRHAANFLTCYLELFGGAFDSWSKADVLKCWELAR
jgi:hypothetical protein